MPALACRTVDNPTYHQFLVDLRTHSKVMEGIKLPQQAQTAVHTRMYDENDLYPVLYTTQCGALRLHSIEGQPARIQLQTQNGRCLMEFAPAAIGWYRINSRGRIDKIYLDLPLLPYRRNYFAEAEIKD